MKKSILTSIIILSLAIHSVNCQININSVISNTEKALTKNNTSTLTNDDIIKGLKEALNVGVNKSTVRASAIDGYYKNAKIKLPFPPEAAKMEKTLRDMGEGQKVDEFVMTLNRAAEEAAKQAANIFLNAITNLTISDGMNILKGADNAATQYLKDKTSAELKIKFKPIVHDALQKVEITKYWNPLVETYNKIPFVQKMNPDLDEYTTQKAIEGLFKLVEEEELKIRKDPVFRTSDILKKVFGELDKK